MIIIIIQINCCWPPGHTGCWSRRRGSSHCWEQQLPANTIAMNIITIVIVIVIIVIIVIILIILIILILLIMISTWGLVNSPFPLPRLPTARIKSSSIVFLLEPRLVQDLHTIVVQWWQCNDLFSKPCKTAWTLDLEWLNSNDNDNRSPKTKS